jgi:thiamine kinase-like enzyme
MLDDSFKLELEKVLSEKLGKQIKINSVEHIGSGYHSDGFHLSCDGGEEFFLKKHKSFDMGFEFPERKIASLLVSHFMANRINSDKHPKSIGVLVRNDNMEFLPTVNDNTEIYNIQTFGGKGKNYSEILAEKTTKTQIDSKDKSEIGAVVKYLAELHKMRHPSGNVKQLCAVYNDFLRNVIGHQEYMLMLLHGMSENDVVLSPREQGSFVGLMLENMHYFKDRIDRLRAIHGDFWGANVFFSDNGEMFVIDHSRMPWGDPAFDVGFWLSQYVIKYHETSSDYFVELGNYFLERYKKEIGDLEIGRVVPYILGLIAAIYASSKIVPDMKDEVRKALFEHVVEMLRKKEFFWP